MARMRLTTYHDAISHLADYLGAASDEDTIRRCRRAVQLAYNSVTNARTWSYLYTRGRIVTVAPQTSSTITYDHSGGSSERLVTLASGTWPSWVTNGSIVIDDVPYPIATNPSTTTITLTPSQNPGADVAAGTTYTLYRDTYTLPIDFTTADMVKNISSGKELTHQHLGEWLGSQYGTPSQGSPNCYSITGAPNYLGTMAMRFHPVPSSAEVFDFIYKRRPRQLNQVLYSTGTVEVASDDQTITGVGTTWTSAMAGAVMRFAAQGDTNIPTGPGGQYPSILDRTIMSFTSATSVEVDAVPGQAITTGAYAISDPVDIEEGAMLTFFFRECEKQARIIMRMKPTEDEAVQYAGAKIEAFEADNRSSDRQTVGGEVVASNLWALPAGSDQGTE